MLLILSQTRVHKTQNWSYLDKHRLPRELQTVKTVEGGYHGLRMSGQIVMQDLRKKTIKFIVACLYNFVSTP